MPFQPWNGHPTLAKTVVTEPILASVRHMGMESQGFSREGTVRAMQLILEDMTDANTGNDGRPNFVPPFS